MRCAGLVKVKRIGILHQKFAAAHDAKARAHLVAELPLDVIEIERQVLVAAHTGAENFGDHLFVGGAKQHVARMPVFDAQHFLAVVVIAPRLAPQVRRLDHRHQQLDGPRPVLLLAHNGVDLVEHAQAQRQPGVNAGRLLPDHAGAQHQPMRDNLRLFGGFTQDGEKVAGQAHGFWDSGCKANRAKTRRIGDACATLEV